MKVSGVLIGSVRLLAGVFIAVLLLGPPAGAEETASYCGAVMKDFPEAALKAAKPSRDKIPYDRFDYSYTRGWRADVPLGIGHLTLEPTEEFSKHYYDWHSVVRLPLYDAPGGKIWGWYSEEVVFVASSGKVVPVGTTGMVETGYEINSFVVVEDTGGWLRFRFSVPDILGEGMAWLPRCLLSNLSPPLRYESWQERFTSGEISFLYFRSKVPHSLRAGPDAGSEKIAAIKGDHHLEPLEFSGDWMRVKVKMPSDYCAGPGDMKSKELEGWVKWRDEERGPWVWYWTRGC